MRTIRKKFKRPKKPWDSTRIADEKTLMKDYGLRNKRELWRAQEILRSFRRRARELIAVEDPVNKKILMDKLTKLGILSKEAELDDVLALQITSILERRRQTIVLKKRIAQSPLHARQMITHGHVYINEKRTKFPSFLVESEQESGIRVRG